MFVGDGWLRKAPRVVQTPNKTFEQMIIVLVWTLAVIDGLLLVPKHEARLDEIAASIGRVKDLPVRTAPGAKYGKRRPRTRGWQPEEPVEPAS